MEKQFYGNITNTARTQFQFDRIYPNRKEMDESCNSDGIYVGRYILVEYDEDPTRNAIELIKKNNIFWYADFPTVQVIPHGTEKIPATIAPKRLCYVKENNIYTFYETQDDVEEPFKEICQYIFEENNYDTNWMIDYSKYSRGFDSTVWQKIYKDNKEKYIMIAELNTVVPNFTISTDAPSEIPTAPHFDENSTDLNYNLHMPTTWDFRVKAAEEGAPSDETVIHRIRYDNNGNLLEEEDEIEVRADIFYNKDAFVPYTYEEIEIISEEGEEYTPNKYYYKINNVYGLCKENYENNKVPKDEKFYTEINLSSPKTNYYTNTENLKLIDLLREGENKWVSNTYYYINSWNYIISTSYNSGEQYYEQNEDRNGYSPISITSEEDYKPDTYYTLTKTYSIDQSENFNENIAYYIKEGESYSPINLVDKDVYELNKYYKFYEEYYILDNSETKVENRQYYTTTDNINYTEINFTKKKYIPNTYYYENSDGNYLIDTSENGQKGVQYYIRSIPAVKEGVDKITILPTGQSGRLYNGHGKEGIKAVNDIQEISINFPSVGKTIAEVWNLVYGKERNELIYGTPLYNQNMYNENGEPLYQTGIGNLDNFVGIINQVNDLIGHNIIKINSLDSIQINSNGTVIINNNESNIKVENLDRYIYYIVDSNEQSEKGYYRLIKTKIGVNEYDLKLIKMSSFNNTIDTIYETLIQIQAALGTNETIKTASTDSLKGALLLLKEVIEEQSKGIDFMTVGESLAYEKNLAWKDIFGTPLYQDYNKNTFVKASYYANKEEEYENYSTHKFFTPYIKELPTEISESSYQELYGLKRFDIKNITSQEEFQNAQNTGDSLYYYDEEDCLFKEAENYDNSKTYFVKNYNSQIYTSFKDYYFDSEQENGKYLADYSIFTEKSFEEIETPLGEDYYVVVLPSYYYYVYNEEEGKNIKVYSTANIFTEVIEYYMYYITHDDPRPSNNEQDNKIYGTGKFIYGGGEVIFENGEEVITSWSNTITSLSGVKVNKKGHIYDSVQFILPQAIVSDHTPPEDAPIGTLWYDISTNNS